MRDVDCTRRLAVGVVLGLAGLSSGCESGSSGTSGRPSGPSPEWIEQFHREQLRHEYEQQQYQEQMQGR